MWRKYRKTYILGLQESLEYRINYLLNLLSVIVPIAMQYFVWNTVFAKKESGEMVYGLTYEQAIIYTLCAGLIGKLLFTNVHHEISRDIKEGGLSRFLVQPIGYIPYRISKSIGEKTTEFFIVGGLLSFFLFVVSPLLKMNTSIERIILFLIAIIPAFLLNFMIFLCVSIWAFWIVEVGRLYAIIDILVAIVSGAIFPLTIFGDKVELLLSFLPFSYTTYFLAQIINGQLDLNGFIKGLSMQFLWCFLLGCFIIITWKQGMKKYTAVGG